MVQQASSAAATSSSLLAALLFVVASVAVVGVAEARTVEDALFDFDNDGYVPSSPFGFYRGYDHQQPAVQFDDNDDNDDNDDQADQDFHYPQQQQLTNGGGDYGDDDDDVDAESVEPNDMASVLMSKQALKSMYEGKPTAAAPAVKQTASSSGGNKHRSYCHPPNPCPKGHTPEKNGCDANVHDTAEWNRLDQERNMRMGICACDVEHMFSCPPGVPTVSVATAKQQQQEQQSVGGKRSPAIFI